MGEPQERDDSIRISRRTLVLGTGAAAILGIGYLLGSRRGDPVPVYIVQPTLATTPARATATKPALPTGTFDTKPLHGYSVRGKEITKDVDRQVVTHAEHVMDLIFNSPNPVEDVFKEYGQDGKKDKIDTPTHGEGEASGIIEIKKTVLECGARINGYGVAFPNVYIEDPETWLGNRIVIVALDQSCNFFHHNIGGESYLSLTYHNDARSTINPKYGLYEIRIGS